MSHKFTALASTRATASLTHEQLAVKSGLSVHYLQRAELGNEFEAAESARLAAALSSTLVGLGKLDTR